MGHMKKYSCPHCQTTTSVIRKTKRGKSIRYFCKACTKYFSIVAPSENYHNWARYFSYYRIISDHPELLVCDDNVNIKMAARARFPAVTIQTCTNHFKENIRLTLNTRSAT